LALPESIIIFLEPANLKAFRFPLKENIVWAPHFYPLSFASSYSHGNITKHEADLRAEFIRFVLELGSPFGRENLAFMRDMSCNEWFEDATRLFDKYQVGWAWCAFGQDARREHTIPDCVALPSS
jgi:hypothetical protein